MSGLFSYSPIANSVIYPIQPDDEWGPAARSVEHLSTDAFAGKAHPIPVMSRGYSAVDLLLEFYSDVENQCRINYLNSRTTYNSPVNFNESLQTPRHRWFPYKEGFSSNFVREFLEESGLPSESVVLDPFAGSGTTPIVASSLNHFGIGFDVSPLTHFVSSAKVIELSAREKKLFERALDSLIRNPLRSRADAPANQTVNSYFEDHTLQALLSLKQFINKIENDKIASLMKVAFLSLIESFSTHRKTGNGVKKKTNYTPLNNVRIAKNKIKGHFLQKCRIILDDMNHPIGNNSAEFYLNSCLDSDSYKSIPKVDCVLTSPPYANCFDYSKIYMTELWLGDFFSSKADQSDFRAASVRSHVHATWEDRFCNNGLSIVRDVITPYLNRQELWSKKIGGMVSGYFSDLGTLLTILKSRVTSNARLGFVVGNSFYGGIPIATDLLLAELGRQHGFDVEEIRVYRSIIPSSQEYNKQASLNKHFMRESLVVLRS